MWSSTFSRRWLAALALLMAVGALPLVGQGEMETYSDVDFVRANLTGHEGRRATVDLHTAVAKRFSVGMVTARNCSDERDRLFG